MPLSCSYTIYNELKPVAVSGVGRSLQASRELQMTPGLRLEAAPLSPLGKCSFALGFILLTVAVHLA